MGSDGSEMVVLNAPVLSSVLTLVYLGIVIAAGALAWRFIEMPGQSLFGRGKNKSVQPRAIG
jgi:peptidoglycan/LPS O-acetylase OafA/YrhL